MKKILLYLSLAIAMGVLGYQTLITFLPNLAFQLVKYRSAQAGRADYELGYLPLPDDEATSVVMPNPDFLYVAKFYDLDELGSVRITGEMPDSTYWSVSFYKPNTVNWYVKNDQEYDSNLLDLILTQDAEKVNINSVEVIEAPEASGFLLIRILVTDVSPQSLQRYETLQRTIKLEKLKAKSLSYQP